MPTNSNSIHDTVIQAVERVLRDSGREAPTISTESTLGETLKLDSLDLAVVVVALETELGIDPFRSEATPVQTVGDLIRVYETAQSADRK